MKKFKMLTTIASIAMCLAVMVFGVMAANQVTFSITSTISYTVQDVFVDIETRVYSCNKIFEDSEELADISMFIQERCQGGSDADDGALDAGGYYDLSPVNLGEFGDVYKFTSTSPSDTPGPLALDLEYSTEEEIYSYFMVIKVTNLGSIPLYSFVKNNDYVAPGENNLAYKQDGYIELQNRNDYGYIVFAIGIENIAENVPESTFNFPIEVAKEQPSNNGPKNLTLYDDVQFVPSGDNILISTTSSTMVTSVSEIEENDGTEVAHFMNFTYSGDNLKDIEINITSEKEFLPVYLIEGFIWSVNDILNISDNSLYMNEYVQEIAVKEWSIFIDKNRLPQGDFNFVFIALTSWDSGEDLPTYYNFNVLSSVNNLYYVDYDEIGMPGTKLEEKEVVEINLKTDYQNEEGIYSGYVLAEFSNVTTTKEYIKITSDITTAFEQGWGIAIVDNQLVQSLLESGQSDYQAQARLACWIYWEQYDEIDGFYAKAEFDEDGYYSWIIPVSVLNSGSFEFNFITCWYDNNGINFNISYEFVD